jgi:DNA polymerase bacteriophage-type
MSGLEIDFETRSAVDLRKHGVYNYMDDATTAPLMASFKIDGGPVMRWRPPHPCPPEIVAHVTNGGMISAHNAAFERLLWQKVLTPRYGWPEAETEQFRCTAATAAAMALPRALGDLGAALDLDVQKDKEGSRLIRKFSVPRRDGTFNAPEGPDFELFHDYCDTDVETEAEADRRMVPLSTEEQDLYVLSERQNDRGIRIDVKSARAALALAEKAKKMLDRKMRLVTGGYVPSCSNPGKLVEWVQSQGVEMPSAAKAEIEELLALDDLPGNVREAIELRQEAAKTSVSKLQAMLDRAGADGRVRGTFMYHGASTGRWTSMGVNFTNLQRPRRVYEDQHPNVEDLFQAFRSEDPDLLPFLYGPE